MTAVATDNSGFLSFSAPVQLFVTEQMRVTITAPAEATTFPPMATFDLKAEVSNTGGVPARKVEFFANGALIGAGLETATNQYTYKWFNVPDGIYSITAVATDSTGLQWFSPAVNIAVNTAGLTPTDFVWFDDAPPPGAVLSSHNGDGWHWVDSNPAAILGSKAHQSTLADGPHLHAFENVTLKLPLNNGERLYTYVFLHPGFMPQEIMLEWRDETGWDHRAYWSNDNFSRAVRGQEGTASLRRMGPMPQHSRWVRLEVPAELVGLNGRVVDGMSFLQVGGRATWDRAGKASGPAPPPPPATETVWFDDAPPQGARLEGFNDDWFWVPGNTRGCPVRTPSPFSGQRAHQTFYNCESNDNVISRAHFFSGATEKMEVRHGDTLFAYAYLDAATPPEQLILGWNDGTRWYNAYWGTSYLLQGALGTEAMRYMGPIPRTGQWVRLEVPAAYVGLDGKTVSGMYFGMSRAGNRHGLVTWDKAGKTAQLPQAAPFPLYATTPVYRYFRQDSGYFYRLTPVSGDVAQPGIKWHVHANQAPGTLPFYRYRHITNRHFFYSWRRPPNEQGFLPNSTEWKLDKEDGSNGIAFYIYPTGTRPPGAVDLHRFFDGKGYFYSTDRSDSAATAARMTYEEVEGYVFPSFPVLSPVPNQSDSPTFFVRQHYKDFLNREPDAAGLDFWISNITKCSLERPPGQTEEACVEGQRVNVSAAFFLSIEFQETGYLVYRLYNAALDRNNGLLRFDEFLSDSQTVSNGVIVGTPGWEQTLENNKVAFVNEFVARPEFVTLYPTSHTPEQYVDALYAHARVTPGPTERQQAINEFGGAGNSADNPARARVLRKLAEGTTLHQREINRAFVLMQYFGYLRRNPDDSPDNNLDGYNFWLNKLNSFNGNFVQAEMVRAFINSIEYRDRFGPPVLALTSNMMTTADTTAKAGALTVTFSNVTSDGLINSAHVYPASLAPAPDGYVFYNNLAWDVTTTSGVSGPVTLKVNLEGMFNDPATFANLRVFHLENGQWVDRTTLPDFNNRTISASVGTLSPIAVARADSAHQAPIINLTSPGSGQSFTAPADVTIEANAWSASGSVVKVEFLQGNVVLGEDTEAPYSFVWRNVPGGVYPITARATDSNGLSSTTSGVKISVNDLPAVFIATPVQDAVFDYPANITISAYANDNEGIRQVEFFQGTASLGVDDTAPYGVTWSNVGLGVHTLTAVATDNRNATMTSPPVEVTVRNAPPVVAITSPAAGSLLGNAPATVTITAEASDSHGIRQVEFFRNGVSLGVDTTAPYSFNWANVAAGTYSLTAKATDNLDAATTSSAVAVTVSGTLFTLFSDNFDDNSLDPAKWAIMTPGAQTLVFERNQRLELIPPNAAAVTDYNGITSVPLIDMTNAQATVELPQYAPGYGHESHFQLVDPDAGHYVRFDVGGYGLSLQDSVTGYAGRTVIASYTVAQYRYWRLRHDPATDRLLWESSADNSSWTTLRSIARTFAITSMQVRLLAGHSAGVDSPPGTTVFDNLKVASAVANNAPSVSITTPAAGAVFNAPATITLGATASDADGTISKVEFLQNGVLLATDTASPYSHTWSGVAAGSYALTARATDNRGAVSTSAAVNVIVNAPNVAPSVSITSPPGGALYDAPATVNIQASASDADGSIASVEFFRNGVSLGTDTTAPYSFNWANVVTGTYSLTAKATDNVGAATVSGAVSITVASQPSPPRADNIGVYTGSTFQLRVSNTAGPPHVSTIYGATGWTPVVGDWDGNGTATLGVFVPEASQHGFPGQSLFFLSNRLDSSNADTAVVFGLPGDKPVAGDWDGNGTVTVGVYRPSDYTFYLRNTNTAGPADLVVSLSSYYGETPVAGDWDGDGIDTVGMHNSSTATFYLRNTNTSGPLNVSVGFGNIGDIPIVGDWDGDGKTTVGSYKSSSATWYLRNTNTAGPTDLVVQYGTAGNSIPVAGNWDGTRPPCCGDAVWFDDAMPAGAVAAGVNESWSWVHTGPIPFSGTLANQSSVNAGDHGHHFSAATSTLSVATGDRLFTYVYLDPANPPTEVMLQWNDGTWEHRAYWGANNLALGVDGTESRRYMGPLPPAGQWVRLEVPASLVGLEGRTLNGMSFRLYGGRAIWDRTGKTTASPANVLISEFRFRGAGGSADEFVELYNHSDSPVTVCATDGSGGWAVAAADGLTRFTIPNATVLPARGHYLATAPAYGLGSYAAADKSYSAEIADNTGVALFNTRNPAGFVSSNRFDAVGFSSLTNSLYFEGTGLSPLGAVNGEYSFVRRFAGAYPQDTNNNAADFAFVSNTGDFYGGTLASMLGGAGPENLFSPLLRNGTIGILSLDPAAAASVSPNRVRLLCDQTPDCNPTTAPIGTLVVRRKLVNNTGVTLTGLRGRITDLTTLNSPGYTNASQADMRAINSVDSNVTLTDGSTVLVKGATLEQPPNQPAGGGFNSTLRVPLPAGGLPPGGSVNVQFVLGMHRSGTFRFLIITEALP